MELTDRQRQVLDYIREKVTDRGYPPSVREIGEAVGLSSPSSVHSHLNSLVEAGYIKRDPSKPRAIMVFDREVAGTMPARTSATRDIPVLGRIAAGTPILAAEHVEDVLTLPVELVGDGPVFLLEVKGDSMVDAGIHDGDLVAVNKQPEARDGEIVAALVDGEEATVKRLRRRDGKVILESENPEKDVAIYINSPGGSVSAGLAIYDTMQFIKPDVSTLCIGQAASMGALLLAAGAKGKRFALPNSRMMIHQPMGGFQGQASDIEIHAKEILYLRQRLNDQRVDPARLEACARHLESRSTQLT